MLAAAGATAADDRATAEFYERTWAGPSLTVHSIGSGDPLLHKTSIGAEARASLSLRVAPGQDPARMHELLERRLREACPAHATLELEPWPPGSPAFVSPDEPVIASSMDAIERATGVRPVAMRSGGSIPVMAALVARGTPTILSGFATNDDNIHSPNERMRLRNLEWAIAAGAEIFRSLAGLEPGDGRGWTRPSKGLGCPAMRMTSRGMSEYQVRTRLYEPPEMVRRLEAKLACWKISTAPRMRGEDLRKAFEERLDSRTPDVVAAPTQDADGPRIG